MGQLADLIVPDRDFFACAESEIADTTSDLTIVGGKFVFAAGEFRALDDAPPPPAMPDWSPVRRYGGYAAWGDPEGAGAQAVARSNACNVHGHEHAHSRSDAVPTSDLRSFWGALGCACWAF